MSGRHWLLIAALVASAALAIDCGGDADGPVQETTLPSPVNPLLSADIALDVALGRDITSEQAQHFLPLLHEGRQVSPVAFRAGQFIVAETDFRAAGDAPQRFALWDPVLGTRSPLWEVPAGKQDIVSGIAGSQLVVVRAGMSLPFSDWELHLRDLDTDTIQPIAASDPRVSSAPGVTPSPPFGFAPYPSISNGRLAWLEYVMVGDTVERLLRLHEFETASTRTLASARLAAMEDLGAAAIGGDRAAWVRWLADGSARIEVHDLAAGTTTTLEVAAKPYAIALDGAGGHLAWDDARGGKYLVALDGGQVRRFAGDEGWGLTVFGNRFSWAPAAAYGGTGGYYDLATGELRLIERRPGVQVNQALVLGDWFVWQQLTPGAGGTPDLAASGYHFLPLAGS